MAASYTESELDRKLHLIQTTPIPRDHGRCPSISVRTCKGVTIVATVHDTCWDKALYYSVGVSNNTAYTTEWGETNKYDIGECPSVALICIEDVVYAIECHRMDKRCYYRVGKVYINGRTIVWGPSIELCRGRKPKVCANDNGTVMIIKEEPASGFFSGRSAAEMQYYIGSVNIEKQDVEWKRSEVKPPNFEGAEPNLSIASDQVVLVCRHRSAIRFKMGTIQEDLAIVWEEHLNSNVKTKGNHPCVSLNSRGNILAFHQEDYTRAMCFWYGRVEGNLIVWNLNRVHDNGEYISVFLSDDGYTYEIHKSKMGRTIWYTQGELKKVD